MSDLGTLVDRFWAKVDKTDRNKCWLWTGAKAGFGYGLIGTGSRTDGSRRLISAHRLSWELHRGPIPCGMFVLHRCDEPRCVNPVHLFLGTHADNMADKKLKGREAVLFGESHGRSKLTDANVREIRALKGVLIQKQNGALFGISQAHVSKILLRKQWAHVSGGN